MKRDGRWLVPQRMQVRVTGGSVTLDFTEAVILQPSLLIDADVSEKPADAGDKSLALWSTPTR